MVKVPVEKPDLTLKFFQNLTGEENPVLTINVFPEKHGCMVRPDIFHGQYDEVMQKAKRLNDQGACVAHCINKTDLKGRKVKISQKYALLWWIWTEHRWMAH